MHMPLLAKLTCSKIEPAVCTKVSRVARHRTTDQASACLRAGPSATRTSSCPQDHLGSCMAC